MTTNTDYFREINTNEKAQVLGFIYADGHVSGNYLRINLADQDLKYLKKLRDILSPGRRLEFINYGDKASIYENMQNQHRLNIGSKEMVSDLCKLGVVPRKSRTLEWPKFLSRDLLKFFLLGYFEGDGSIHVSQKSYVIGFIGTEKFCNGLSEYLRGEIPSLQGGISKHKKSGMFYFRFGGNLVVENFCQWLYGNCSFRMNRKYIKFKELKNTNRNKNVRKSSQFLGVTRRKDNGKFRAIFTHKKHKYNLGHFDTGRDAAIAYNAKAAAFLGAAARLNDV